MELEEALGKVLRRARKRQGYSQEELALEAGVERNYISLIELGRNSPSMRVLYKVCKPLGVLPTTVLAEVDVLMTGSTEKRPATR